MLRPDDLSKLSAHDFPGNVRELRNVLERSLLRCDSESKWLALDLNWLNRSAAAAATARTGGDAQSPPPAVGGYKADEPLPADRQLTPIEAQEYRLIRDTLGETNGGIRRAATKLGMSPQALLRRLEKWPELRGTKS